MKPKDPDWYNIAHLFRPGHSGPRSLAGYPVDSLSWSHTPTSNPRVYSPAPNFYEISLTCRKVEEIIQWTLKYPSPKIHQLLIYAAKCCICSLYNISIYLGVFIFTEPFERKLESLWNFTPKYFSNYLLRNKDIVLHN